MNKLNYQFPKVVCVLGPQEQIEKIVEECEELEEAWDTGQPIPRVLEEAVDVWQSLETYLRFYTDEEVQAAFEYVLAKNRARGYYG